MSRRLACVGIALAAAFVAACSSSPPAAPSGGQVAGAWIGDATLTGVSGGECVGAALQGAAGRRDVFLAALAGEGTLQATITSQGNGTSCAYAGSATNGAVNLQLVSCQTNLVSGMACGGADRRDLLLTGGTISARADSRLGTGSGTETTSWSVLAAGSQQVGILSVASSFNWVFLGLPPSDYHVFTGTVFPGYADGTISIPADPNPWCQRCGWFY